LHQAISSEQAGYYKPHAGVYRHALEELGLSGGQVLHVAAHSWDIRGARTAGMFGAYINRYEIPYVDADGSQADLEVSGLVGLSDRLPSYSEFKFNLGLFDKAKVDWFFDFL
ncbi:MAG: hypothetical protein VX895_06560, partial [Chloroflexota bacterium]|nr:hypothetical protein [Chloroflexota bacterium]